MAHFLHSLRDLEKQLTFQKGFKEHDNSVLPEHILWMLEYFFARNCHIQWASANENVTLIQISG